MQNTKKYSTFPLLTSVNRMILMDLFHIRIGSDEYAKQNESYGLTTLKEGHVKILRGKDVEGDADAVLDFTGKSGKRWRLLIEDDNLVQMIEESGKVGGKDDDQPPCKVCSIFGGNADSHSTSKCFKKAKKSK